APNDFDHVPTRAAENGFQFLNDFSVAANRAVEALQVTVDDPDQIVEFLARSQSDRSQGFRLVHFSVAEEGPNLSPGRSFQPSIFKIFNETRVINRLDRPQSHADGGELPEVGHQPRMWIGRQSASRFQLAPEVF